MENITSKNYVENAVRTESDFSNALKRFTPLKVRLLHAGMGMCTEAGEFVDQLKKHLFYGTEIDLVNLSEEIGDVMWYCALVMETLGISFDEVLTKNIIKLKQRYPGRFNENGAINRDLEKERELLEK